MAQEVPEASFDNNGYLMVDYSKLDVEFRRIKLREEDNVKKMP